MDEWLDEWMDGWMDGWMDVWIDGWKSLNADQKLQLCQTSEQHLEFFRRDPNNFLSRLLTMDETWLYHYDSETKQQSMEWGHSALPHPKISECKTPSKISVLDFLGSKKNPPN
jgi:hypothetical protein